MTISRRTFVQGAAGVALTGVAAPAVLAQSSDPIRVGLLTVKTGPARLRRHRHGARAGACT